MHQNATDSTRDLTAYSAHPHPQLLSRSAWALRGSKMDTEGEEKRGREAWEGEFCWKDRHP